MLNHSTQVDVKNNARKICTIIFLVSAYENLSRYLVMLWSVTVGEKNASSKEGRASGVLLNTKMQTWKSERKSE